jgi:hypothetical protein
MRARMRRWNKNKTHEKRNGTNKKEVKNDNTSTATKRKIGRSARWIFYRKNDANGAYPSSAPFLKKMNQLQHVPASAHPSSLPPMSTLPQHTTRQHRILPGDSSKMKSLNV